MKRFLALFTMLMLCGALSFAQNRTINGKVIDEKGDPVSGASIIVKGTSRGTSANATGDFSISIKPGEVLQVSAANFGRSEAKVGSESNVSITLRPGSNILEEVVVTALGIKREKRSLTYASETINSDQINKSGSGNPLSELSGKAAGITVINSSGDPGGGTYVRLRGVTSITGDNQPLMVVDGVPIDNSINNYDATSATPNTSGASANLTGGSIPSNRGIDINPNDIESITVLKGPAATALYGIKAASGALIITTKKGNFGNQRSSISFNSSASIEQTNKLPDLQSQYSQGNNGQYLAPFSNNANRRVTWGAKIDTLSWDGNGNEWDQHGNIVGNSDPSAKIPVVPYDRYNFFKNGFTNNTNISVTGGSEKTSYRVSLGNLYQKGIVPLSKYNKTTFGVSGQAKLTEKFTISGGINFIVSANNKVQQGSNTSGVMLGLLRTPPTFDNANSLSDPENNLASYFNQSTQAQRNYRGGGGYDNPYWTVNRNPFGEDVNREYGYAQASYKFWDWMTVSYRLGGDVYSQDSKNFYDIKSSAFPAGKGIITDYFNNQYNSDLTVSLQKSFGSNWSGNLLLGQNYFYTKSKSRLTIGDGLITPTFFDIVNALSYSASELDGEKRTAAVYGQAELSYANMLFFNLTGRRETSSSLPESNRNFFYPSVGLGFVFTQLPGFKNNSQSLLSFGKLRLSYAQVGKDAPIQGLQTYYGSTAMADGFTPGILFPISFNGVPTGAYQITSTISVIGNPDLKPEKTSSYEIGLDLGLWNNRINFAGTYYYSKTSDAIFTVPYAYSTGFASKLQNAGELVNKGIEISLNTTPVKTKNFTWDLNLNFSTNKNTVTKLFNGVEKILLAGFQNGEIDAFAGEPYGQIYGSIYQRANPGTGSKVITGGELLINDVQGAGYTQPIVGTQNALLGNVNPKWLGTVVNNLTFKGLTFGFQIDVKNGGDVWNGTRGALSYFGTSQETANRGASTVFQGLLGHLNAAGEIVHFAPDGVTEVPGAGSANTLSSVYDQNYWQNIGSSFVGPSEQSVEDGGYVKLRQVSLTAALPKKLLGNKFNNVSFTVYANNIILSTKYTGVDPETNLAGPANGQGLDYFNNPSTKSFGARLNIGL
ncbi:MAG: SusC/RagA family TonB-linked outer membrane protein [Ginsengibacter sp.]